MGDNGAGASSRDEVLEALRSADKLIVVTHENLDGDALGSLIAMQDILTAQGRDSLMFIDAGEFPLPTEYQFFPLSGLPAFLTPQPIEFLTLRCPQATVATARIALGLGKPVPDRLRRWLKLPRQFLRRAASLHQFNHLPTELRRVGSSCL